MSAFLDESIAIADNFIRTICFIDDEVIFGNGSTSDHLIDANSITKIFAENNKACSFFNFQSITEQQSILKLIHNCDVCVLDWKLTLLKPEVNQIAEDDEELDVEDDNDRGKHAREIITEILQSPYNSPKLVIIYTGETESQPIYDSIKVLLNGDIFQESPEELWIQNSKLRISIYFKPSRTDSHLAEITNKIADYSEFPNIICKEFALLTNGIISNVVLKAITSLRDNTNTLLQIYKKELDPAYLAHRGMVENPEDSEILLKNALINSIDSILTFNNVLSAANINSISNWVDKVDEFQHPTIEINSSVSLPIDKETIKCWLDKGFLFAINKLWSETQRQQISENKLSSLEKNLHKNAIEYFCPRGVSHLNLNEDFAILTHHNCSLINPIFVPHLTLGVVIERYSQYYLCIQQRCDSIRIDKLSPRSLIFVPLEESEKNFSIIFKNSDNTYIKLKVNNKNCFNLKTIHFLETLNGAVFAQKHWDKYKFFDTHKRSYNWILNLNESHAQRIANEFAASLARVGLDESEWLRRNSNNA